MAAIRAPLTFHFLTKPIGSSCNLNCKYCFFLSKERLYPGSSFRMTDDLLEEYIRQYIKRQRTVMIKSELVFKGGIDESTYDLVAPTA
jgi:sulfatase maturation enzyme AslB (radical SAM superfamily)